MKAVRILSRNIRDSFKSVFRNFSLSLASISCITITLIVVAISIVLSQNVNNFAENVEKDVTIVVFLDVDIEPEQKDFADFHGIFTKKHGVFTNIGRVTVCDVTHPEFWYPRGSELFLRYWFQSDREEWQHRFYLPAPADNPYFPHPPGPVSAGESAHQAEASAVCWWDGHR